MADGFSHFSDGHRGVGCIDCHDIKSEGKKTDLNLATTLANVPVPSEAYGACRRCHVEKRQRFHWR